MDIKRSLHIIPRVLTHLLLVHIIASLCDLPPDHWENWVGHDVVSLSTLRVPNTTVYIQSALLPLPPRYKVLDIILYDVQDKPKLPDAMLDNVIGAHYEGDGDKVYFTSDIYDHENEHRTIGVLFRDRPEQHDDFDYYAALPLPGVPNTLHDQIYLPNLIPRPDKNCKPQTCISVFPVSYNTHKHCVSISHPVQEAYVFYSGPEPTRIACLANVTNAKPSVLLSAPKIT